MKGYRFHLSLLIFIFLFCFVGPLFYEVDPLSFNKDRILLPPSLDAPFGTDRLGRDMLARVMEGGRNSLIIGFSASFVSSVISLVVGSMAGIYRGVVDRGVVILIDLFLTVPTFFLLLALVAYIEMSPLFLVVIIAASSWMSNARLIRSETYAISDKPFIKILKIGGVSTSKIVFKYYASLLSPILLTGFVFGVSGAILAESSLSFLGLGIVPPDMSWGGLLSDGKDVMDIAPWVSFFPGFMIFLVTLTLISLSFKLQNEISSRGMQV